MSSNISPNVLLLMTDAQRRDTLGCYGNRLVRTSAIDSLAAEGVRFTEWHVPNPLCMPARASLMTGHYPSSHGVRTNGMNLGDALPTIAELLVNAGYWTASVGKLHLNFWWADKPGYSQEGRADWSVGRRRIDLPYFGFQAVDMAIGHNEIRGVLMQSGSQRSVPKATHLCSQRTHSGCRRERSVLGIPRSLPRSIAQTGWRIGQSPGCARAIPIIRFS